MENLKHTNLIILGNNVAGITGKSESLKRAIEVFHPGVIMLQETKCKKEGKLKLKGFLTFEKLRAENQGGGLMTIVHENLKPIQISDDHPEFFIADINGNFGSIRSINCYGPQENMSTEIRTDFFIELESRIISAQSSGKLVCIECDANSKLGKEIISGDPHAKSHNGKLLYDVITRQNLIVVNATEKCYGTITRYKKTKNGTEESVIDFFIVSQELYENVNEMLVDEERKYVLSRFYKSKSKTTIVASDHNILVLEINLKWSQKIIVNRKEIYNLKSEEGQKIFKHNTSNNQNLIDVLRNQDIGKSGKKWLKELQHEIAKSFKRIRISNKIEKMDKNESELFIAREKFKGKIANTKCKEEIKNLEKKMKENDEKIADIHAESYFKTVKDNLDYLIDDTENLNCIKMWQLKKKIFKKNSELPSAKIDENGEIVTTAAQLKKLYKNTYENRLKHRKIKPELIKMYTMKMDLFELRNKVCKNIKSKPWTNENLLRVLRSLKNNKSADSSGLIYELFKPEIIGSDLFTSLLMFCNKMKPELIIPEMLTLTTITSIYKQ